MQSILSNELEAANRAEVTALLIRCGHRVYRPEADVHGEDLVIRTPDGELLAVQLKSRMSVDEARYGGDRNIWMLFPGGRYDADARRSWFLIPHRLLFERMKGSHGHAAKWNEKWSTATGSKEDLIFLRKYEIRAGSSAA